MEQIGMVLRPRGLQGELKIQIHTNILGVFSGLKSVRIGERDFKVTKSSIQNNFAYLRIDGVNDANTADRLRDEIVYVERKQLPLDKDEVLAEDLIGFAIVNEKGQKIGTLKEIHDTGGAVMFDCETFAIPNEDEFVLETNMTEKKIVVRLPR